VTGEQAQVPVIVGRRPDLEAELYALLETKVAFVGIERPSDAATTVVDPVTVVMSCGPRSLLEAAAQAVKQVGAQRNCDIYLHEEVFNI